MAPASSSASAWTRPSPRAAPETRTTLSARLNSGRRFGVAMKVDDVLEELSFWEIFGDDAGERAVFTRPLTAVGP